MQNIARSIFSVVAVLSVLAVSVSSAAVASPQNARAYKHKPPPAGWSERCARPVARSFQEVMRAADTVADEIDRLDDRRDRRRLEADLEALLTAIDNARDAACDAAQRPNLPPPPPPPVVVYQPVVLSGAAFDEVLRAVKQESLDEGKQRVIAMAISGDTCVTVDQVAALMGTQSFSSAKVGVAKGLLPRVVDKERAFALSKSLTFSSEREELAAAVTSAVTIPVCIAPR
jgi:hypothetical protein